MGRRASICTITTAFLLVCAGGGLSGCTHAEDADPGASGRGPEADAWQAPGTARMADELARLHGATLEAPLAYYYLNSQRAARAAHALRTAAEAAPFALRFAHADELLKAGATEGAIEGFARLRDEVAEAGPDASRESRSVYEALAIAYLRLGEQQNCIQGHTPEACILPLRGGGLHTDRAASRRAVALYQEILSAFRRDYGSRWLLNVAHMTLGSYPHGVPENLRIPGVGAPPAPRLSPFRNVAGPLGVEGRDLSGGVSVADFDGDGFLDILTTAFRLDDPIRLYLSDGRGGFVDHTAAAGLSGLGGGLNTVHADYDNDGDVDVFVLRGAWLGDRGGHPNSLLQNRGDGTFEDVTHAAGLLSYHPTQTAAWGDYNQDGWLDLFVGNESSSPWLSAWQGEAAASDGAHRSELYLNNADGTFTEVAGRVGLDLEAFVKGGVWGDVDNDGLPDLYVSVMGGPNRLFWNRGGPDATRWRFEEIGGAAGVHAPFFSFPTWFWDYDNDGWEDLFVASYDLRRVDEAGAEVAREYLGLGVETEGPRLYRNDGAGAGATPSFTDVTESVGLDRVLFAMGAGYGDLDNDGYEDVYVGTGAPDLRAIIPNRMFRSDRGTSFEDVTFDGAFGHLQKGHAIAFADFDGDGDQDIYAVLGGFYEGDVFQNALFENPGRDTSQAWVTLRLEGRRANRSALGARLRLTVTRPDGSRQILHRTVSTGGSFGGSSLQQEIGLGPATRIDELRIVWPGPARTVDVFTDVEVRRAYRAVEGQPLEAPSSRTVSFRLRRPSSHEHGAGGGDG